MTVRLDSRLNAFRTDLADTRLKGRVKATRFTDGRPAYIDVPVCDVKNRPEADAGVDTQFKLNERVTVFDEADGWSWIQSNSDGYVGYVQSSSLTNGAPETSTHRVTAPRTFCYPEPDLKSPCVATLSLGTEVCIVDRTETRGTPYVRMSSGLWIFERHLNAVESFSNDYVDVAESLLGTPYLWGGNSAFGIDCSGLVQLSMAMCGNTVLRDSDMQFETVGEAVDPSFGLQRGDLIFWKGHVAIVRDAETIIHANAHTMSVAIEITQDAIDRIAYLYAEPIGYKRPN
ncbi:MAG: NlpC/P60 family protein [Pseudomonadota bacterium]